MNWVLALILFRLLSDGLFYWCAPKLGEVATTLIITVGAILYLIRSRAEFGFVKPRVESVRLLQASCMVLLLFGISVFGVRYFHFDLSLLFNLKSPLFWLYLIFLAPFFEETIYRQAFPCWLRKNGKSERTIAISSSVFFAIHHSGLFLPVLLLAYAAKSSLGIFGYLSNLEPAVQILGLQTLLALPMGFLLFVIRKETQSLIGSILVHGLFNLAFLTCTLG